MQYSYLGLHSAYILIPSKICFSGKIFYTWPADVARLLYVMRLIWKAGVTVLSTMLWQHYCDSLVSLPQQVVIGGAILFL